MIFTASRGQAFKDKFTFKNEKGKPLNVPSGEYRLILERGEYVTEFKNLTVLRDYIGWNMTAAETNALKYSTMYFTLYLNGQEIARGVLRVQ